MKIPECKIKKLVYKNRNIGVLESDDGLLERIPLYLLNGGKNINNKFLMSVTKVADPIGGVIINYTELNEN